MSLSLRLIRRTAWWWNLTEAERAEVRLAFLERFDTDPAFRDRTLKLLEEYPEEDE